MANLLAGPFRMSTYDPCAHSSALPYQKHSLASGNIQHREEEPLISDNLLFPANQPTNYYVEIDPILQNLWKFALFHSIAAHAHATNGL